MPRLPLALIALLAACTPTSIYTPEHVNTPTPSTRAPSTRAPFTPTPGPARAPASADPRSPPSATYRCTEVIGLTITAEWYRAGFEQLVDDARFQARTRPHTFVEQWADPKHEAWTGPLTSPCAEHPESPDRVVLFAANWTLQSQDDWTKVLEAFVATAQTRYPELRELALYTVLRGPQNQSCGDPKSIVDPMIDSAIATVAAAHPKLVHAGPRLEAAACSVFEKGGPHFTEEGRELVAKQLADALR